MTAPSIRKQAIRSMRRHSSETTLLRRDGRYVNRKLVQAAPPDEDRWDFALLMLAAVVAAPLVWGVLFAFFMFVAPGPVR